MNKKVIKSVLKDRTFILERKNSIAKTNIIKLLKKEGIISIKIK